MTRRKGNANEERVCWFFHHNGYVPWSPSWGARGHGRFRSTDILGVFDVLAVNKSEAVLVQVKTDDGFRKKVEQEVKDVTLPPFIKREYWLFKPNDEVYVRRYSGSDYKQFSINFDLMRYENVV